MNFYEWAATPYSAEGYKGNNGYLRPKQQKLYFIKDAYWRIRDKTGEKALRYTQVISQPDETNIKADLPFVATLQRGLVEQWEFAVIHRN